MAFLSVTPGSLSVTNEIAKRDFTYVRTYVLAEIWTRISCLALMRSATKTHTHIHKQFFNGGSSTLQGCEQPDVFLQSPNVFAV